MAHPFYKWSLTASANANADSTINWAEGQSPSSVNDSARAMMASAAAYRDDVSGAIFTAGSSTAYTVTTNQVYNANIDGAMVAFTVHATNGANATLSVDGNTARAIHTDPNNPVAAGVLVAGTPYVVRYDAAHTCWLLHGFYNNLYQIPLGGCIDFFAPSAPNSSFAFPYGQAISRTTYSALFFLIGTTYGSGNGSTTFNIPDLRGRVVAGKDDMGGSSASRLSGTTITSGSAATLGGSGGAETKTLTTANLPPYTPAGSVSVTSTVSDVFRAPAGVSTYQNGTGSFFSAAAGGGASAGAINSTGTLSGTAQGGTSTAFGLVQPTIIANKLMRII